MQMGTDSVSDKFLFKEETFEIIGICIEVHKELGHGFLEVVYKEAIEINLKERNIFYEREKEFEIEYKGNT